MRKLALFSFYLLLLNSCNKKETIEDYLIGLRWEVTEMNYKGENYEPYLTFSAYIFEKDGKCSTPIARLKKGFHDKKERFANWTLLDNSKVKIESSQDYLNGEFEICLDKDYENKVVFITIESKDLYVKAYRIFGKGFDKPLPSICK